MYTLKNALALCTAALTATLLVTPALAEEPKPSDVTTSPAGQPNEQEMMAKMMELAKLGENHKLLADIAGTWNYTVKMWMNPDAQAEPMVSKGTATRKAVMGGRYYQFDVKGQMQMPGADGKMKDMEFKGHGARRLRQRETKIRLHLDGQHGHRHHDVGRHLRSGDEDLHLQLRRWR